MNLINKLIKEGLRFNPKATMAFLIPQSHRESMSPTLSIRMISFFSLRKDLSVSLIVVMNHNNPKGFFFVFSVAAPKMGG